MPKVFNLSPVPAQIFDTTIADERYKLGIYQLSTGLFIDMYKNDVLVMAGVMCRNRTILVRSAYLGVTGDFAFVDQEGDDDPYYTGLGTRYVLFYFTPEEVATRIK